MFSCQGFPALFLVLGVVTVDSTSSKPQAYLQLSQSEAESILNAQSTLRRYLIRSLAEIKSENADFNFVVSDILQDLLSRRLNPLECKICRSQLDIRNNRNTTELSRLAKIIHHLKGDKLEDLTLTKIESLLRDVPLVPSVPELNLEKINKINGNLVRAVLKMIQESSLQLNTKLLGDILYNYPFRDFSVALAVVVRETTKKLENVRIDYNPTRSDNPDTILSSILDHISQIRPDMQYKVQKISSALSDLPLESVFKLSELLYQLPNDDYPPDVIAARNDIALEIGAKSTQLDLQLSDSLLGYSSMEKIVGLLTHCILLSKNHFLAPKIHAVHSHVVMRYLSSSGRFFQPRTIHDIEFLLASFWTVPDPTILTFTRAIHGIFNLSEFHWEKLLDGFHFSLYSKPRLLFLDMLRWLLKTPSEVPVSGLIIFNYFLKNTRVPPCFPFRTAPDFFDMHPDHSKEPTTEERTTPRVEETAQAIATNKAPSDVSPTTETHAEPNRMKEKQAKDIAPTDESRTTTDAGLKGTQEQGENEALSNGFTTEYPEISLNGTQEPPITENDRSVSNEILEQTEIVLEEATNETGTPASSVTPEPTTETHSSSKQTPQLTESCATTAKSKASEADPVNTTIPI